MAQRLLRPVEEAVWKCLNTGSVLKPLFRLHLWADMARYETARVHETGETLYILILNEWLAIKGERVRMAGSLLI